MRIERNETARRALWPPFRRRYDVEIVLPLRTIEHLFHAPELDPFDPDYETFGENPGIETIARVLHTEEGITTVRAIIELPPPAYEPSLEQRTKEAVARYCRVKIAELSLELLRIRRYGLRALLVGLVAVLALNALSRPLDTSNDPILDLISQGLQIAAWVTLWFPINVLVYDQWYSRRDRGVYRHILEMEITVAPLAQPPLPADRSTAR